MAKTPKSAAKKPQGKKEQNVVDLQFVAQKDLEATISFTNDCIDLLKTDFSARSQEFVFQIGDDVVETNLGAAVIGLVLVKSRYVLSREMTAEDILLCSKGDSAAKMVSGYYTDTIRMATEEDADLGDLKALIASSLEELADMSFEINQTAGNSINIYDMLQLMQRDEEIVELLNTKIRESEGDKVEYFDANKRIKDCTDRLLKRLKEDEHYNCYKNLLTAISTGQFQQVFLNVGWKPEITSSAIYPHCVDTNLFHGFRNEMDYFVSAMGARKALITNSLQVRKAGYMSRKLLLLSLNQRLNGDDDCGSDEYLEMKVASKDAVKRLNGRYHLVGKKLKVIDGRDETLVGKTIKLRTPITCKGHDGICKTCYGNLWKVNPFHIGVSGVLSFTEQLTQMLLSSKHLLQINPEKVELPKVMQEYFEIDGSMLVGKKHFKVNVQKIDVSDEDETYTSKITILDGDRSIEVEFEEGKEIFVEDPDSISVYKTENIIDINVDTPAFRLNVENSELVTPLKKIIKLLESESSLNSVNEEGDEIADFHSVLATFLELLEKSNIRASSVTIELILRELLRDREQAQRRPAAFHDLTGIKFLKLTNALVHQPAAAITLAFERLNYVVENNIFQKDQESIIDGLY